MSTRDERKRARRLAAAAGTHWIEGAKDIRNRYYAAMRLADLPANEGYVPSEHLKCASCGWEVAIDKRLIPLAKASLGIHCNKCVVKYTGKPFKQIIIDQLNADNQEEI